MDTNQIFKLIDSILSCEVCLYHQVLPLSHQQKSLHLGMVDPEDTAALDYIKRLLTSLQCKLITHKISVTQHQSVLSTYLSYKDNNKLSPNSSSSPAGVKVHKPPTPPRHFSSSSKPAPIPSSIKKPLAAKPAPSVSPSSPESVPVLKLEVNYISRPLTELVKLPPQQLLQELLGRVLLSGIGRLFLERQTDKGRILWTQEGVLQSALDDLPLPLFQALLMELKQFFSLPFVPVDRQKQVEMERLYNKNHLLLLLTVHQAEHGEEATLQVLRGEALNFYRQQKLADLSQDALSLATQLQRKLNEIGAQFDPNLNPESFYALPAIDQLLQSMNQQLKTIETQRSTIDN